MTSLLVQAAGHPAPWLLIALGAAAFLLADAAVRSWRFPGRVDDASWFCPRPAPTLSHWPIGPAAGPCAAGRGEGCEHGPWLRCGRPLDGPHTPRHRAGAPRTGDGFAGSTAIVIASWHDVPAPREFREGATLDWSPAAEVEAAGESLDAWWAERLGQFDDAWLSIEMALRLQDGQAWHPPMAWTDEACTTETELRRFSDASMHMRAYRALQLDATGGYGPREHMQLEALLAAPAAV